MKRMKRVVALLLVFTLTSSILFSAALTEARAKLRLNRKAVTVYVGKTVRLSVKGTKKKVTWKSQNKKVASVSKKGVVKGRKSGKTRITAKVRGKKLICKVTVKKKRKTVNQKPAVTNVPSTDGKADNSGGVQPTQTPQTGQIPQPSDNTQVGTPEPSQTPESSETPGESQEPVTSEEPDDSTLKAPEFSVESGEYDEAFDLTIMLFCAKGYEAI